MLDSEAVPENSIFDWVSANQDFTDWLAGEAKTSFQKLKSIMNRFLADVWSEILEKVQEISISQAQLKTWLELYYEEELRAMGSLGLFNEIYKDKHLNSGDAWHSNDLNDMMFLTCAAGYADYVVGERSLMSYMRQAAKRLPRSIKVYSRLSDLMIVLERTGL